MRITSVLRQQAGKKTFKSLAVSVLFKNPKFNMDDYEILSRGSAFLLAVDAPESQGEGNYGHLEAEETRRIMKSFKRQHGYTPASPGGNLKDMGWLEFIPREYRNNVHVVASSHVLSPFLWKEYYPQEWLTHVRKEHCKFKLEVFDAPGSCLAEFALDGEPFHHPEGRDVALAHLHNEHEILPNLRSLGVEFLRLRDDQKLYEKGENVLFEGYSVTDDEIYKSANNNDKNNKNNNNATGEESNDKEKETNDEDTRVFYPLQESGKLAFHQAERFYATTTTPLPEGMCGGPAVDEEGRCCGVVEGIIPVNYEDKNLAGSAAFMPHFIMNSFIELVERQMVKASMDDDMFQMVVNAKKTNTIGGGIYKLQGDGTYSPNTNWDEANETMIDHLKKQCSKEEFDAMMAVMEEEKKEVQRILKEEGGDMLEIMERVRARTLATRDLVHKQYREAQEKRAS